MRRAADFTGDWQVRRDIADRLTGTRGRFDGRARFEPRGEAELVYAETGRLRLGEGPAFEARRSYVWRFGPERVEVRFEDGRPFHSFRPEGAVTGTDHPCGADLYRVAYDFAAWPLWQVTWEVTGPRKDYAMTGHYSR